MPGIAGIIRRAGTNHNVETLQLMERSMIHEKFYTSGTYANDELGIHACWICHKGSFSDCMPLWSEKKDICLIFSGEDARDISELNDLRSRGHQFGPGNAEYLLHLYEEAGVDFVKKLNGVFSGLLVDLRDKRAFIFNDRYGLGRIYYHETEDELYFSSEAKSLLKVLPNLRELDYPGLGEFFSCGCTLENKTLFSGVSLFPPGSIWTILPHRKAVKDTYIRRESFGNQEPLSKSDYYENLKRTFSNALPRYFRPQEKIAVSLTGGIDTRMIMAWAQLPPFKVPCYTFSGMYRDCEDAKIARKVAAICQQKHKTIKVAHSFLSDFPSLAKKTVYYTDGAMDVSGAIELYVNKLAREIAPIRLTGNYGDQVLRRTVGFKPGHLYEGIFDKEFLRQLRSGEATYERLDKRSLLAFFVFNQAPWHHYARFALERTQLANRSPYLDNDLFSVVQKAPLDLATSIDLSLTLIGEGNPALGRIPTDRGRRQHPIPFFTPVQRLFWEFTYKAEYAYDSGMPQWLARLDSRLASLKLERIFLGRQKFYHYRMWYKNELSNYVEDILLDPRTLQRPYLNRNGIEKIVKEHVTGHGNYTNEIHSLLTCELTRRHLVESLK